MATQTGSIDLKAAKAAADIAKDTSAYFWTNTQDSGAGEGVGAHITKITSSEFLADPANGGGNVLIDTDSVDIRDGVTTLATFSGEGIDFKDQYGNTPFFVGTNSNLKSAQMHQFTGDGTKTSFEVAYPIMYIDSVTVGGVTKTEGVDFTRGTDTITFVSPPASDSTIIIHYYTYASSSTTIGYSFGIRKDDETIGLFSVAEGVLCSATGQFSHAEGNNTEASGEASHAEGRGTASGKASHAEGYGQANGNCSHAEGGFYQNTFYPTIAVGGSAHAEGYRTNATGPCSHAQNLGTVAYSTAQTSIGKYNISDFADKYAVIVGNGNGTDDDERSNALTVDWSGNVEAAGNITANGKNINSFITNFQTPISASASSKSIPTTTYTTIASVILPANGKYIVHASGGAGAGSGMTNIAHRLTVTSGTATTAENPTQTTPSAGGGYASITGYYVTGSAAITVSYQIYLYAGTATGGNCWIEAFQIA